MGMMEAILEGSSLVHHLVEKAETTGREQGLQQGLQQGLERGRAETARRLLRSGLSVSFPGLEAHPAIDRIAGAGQLEAILLSVMAGAQRDEIERLLGRP